MLQRHNMITKFDETSINMIEMNQLTLSIGDRLFVSLDGVDGVATFLLMSFWHNDEGICSQRRYPCLGNAGRECVEFANLADYLVEVPLPQDNHT